MAKICNKSIVIVLLTTSFLFPSTLSRGANGTTKSGAGTEATADWASAFGVNSKARGIHSTALGDSAEATKNWTSALGPYAKARGQSSTAVGDRAQASADAATALGKGAVAEGKSSTAIGNAAKASAYYAIALGNGTVAEGDYSIALGNSAEAKADWASAFGAHSKARRIHSTALGDTAEATADWASAIGAHSKAQGIHSTALGDTAEATADSASAIGPYAKAQKEHSTAVGDTAKASADAATALGTHALADGKHSIALGDGAQANKGSSTAVGEKAKASGAYATALGADTVAEGTYSTAVGYGAEASAYNAIALGEEAVANKDDSISLGSSSNTDTDAKKVLSIKQNDLSYESFAGSVSNTGMQVSIGSKGKERQIKHVASGEISVTSTDAVNGSQLFSVMRILGKNVQSQKSILGGNATLNPDGALTTSDIGKTGKNTIHGAIAYNYDNITQNTNDIAANRSRIATLDAKTSSTKSEVKSGKNLLVTATTEQDGHSLYTVATEDKVAFEEVNIGANGKKTAGVLVDGKGVHITNGPNLTTNGIDVNGLKMSGLGDGEISATSTDAVRGAQLFTVTENVRQNRGNIERNTQTAQSTAAILGGTAKIGSDGTLTMSDIGKTGKNTIHGAIAYNHDNITQNTNDIAANRSRIATLDAKTSSTKSEVKSGKNLLVTATTGKDGHSLYTVATKNEVAFDSATFGDTVIDKKGLRLGKDTVTLNNSGLLIKGGPKITTGGIDVNGLKMSGLGDGEISATSTDAVRGGQLFTVTENVRQNRGNIERNTQTAQSTAAILGGTAKIGSDGTLTMSDIGGTGQNTIDAAIARNRSQIATLDAKTSSTKSEVKSGKNLLVTATTEQDGHSLYTVATKNEVAFDSATFGDTVIDKKGLRLGKDTVTLNNSGLLIKGGPKITTGGIDANGLKISGLGDGEISATSTDAVRGGQLFTVSENVRQINKQMKTQQDAIDKLEKVALVPNPHVDTLTAAQRVTVGASVIDTSGLTIENGPRMTKNGIDGGGKKITNIEAGELSETSNDAITGRQLFATNEKVAANKREIDHLLSKRVIQGSANVSAGILQYADKEAPTLPNGGNKSNDVTLVGKTSGQAVTIHNVGAGRTSTDAVNLRQLHATEGRLNDRLNTLDGRVRAGIASALASAALPQAYLAGESVISAAAANYRGEQALSIGASTVSPNGRWIVKGTANVNHEDASVALGIGYKF